MTPHDFVEDKNSSNILYFYVYCLYISIIYLIWYLVFFSPIPAVSPHRIKIIIMICIHCADSRERNEPNDHPIPKNRAYYTRTADDNNNLYYNNITFITTYYQHVRYSNIKYIHIIIKLYIILKIVPM